MSGTEHVVCQASELPPGQRVIVQVRNLEIGVYNVAGEYYALHNMCPHQFGPACAGPVGAAAICNQRTEWNMQLVRTGEILTCPWHGMEFDLKTGECLSLKRLRLRTFPVAVVDGTVCVTIARPQIQVASGD